ncbi:MAG: peptide chain release factor aRF-1 [Candidatus Bathyarchaeota archaeon]|nr:MAG: peptide chain release factor aRF-1 [Candidatus Bathyarchaeota archaeon]
MSQENPSLVRFRFQRMLEMLERKEGRGTELITVYIPPGKQVSEVMNDLRNEWGTAGNIKSKTTRKNVQDALTKAMEQLKLYTRIPPTGLVIFAGTIASQQQGVGEMETYVLIPPEPIGIYYYRCEHRFMLDPLFELLRTEDSYGIVVLDSKAATFALLKGKRADIVKDISSGVAGKTRAGGQSARRYERLRQMHLNEFFTRVGNYMTDIFKDVPNLKGIIVGGPGPTKEDFLKGNYFHHEIKEKILTTVDTGYTGHEGVKEVVERSQDFLKNVRFYEERKIVQDFLYNVGQETGLATYGEREVIQALRSNNVRQLLISEGVRRTMVRLQCRDCGAKDTRIVDRDELVGFEESVADLSCLKCGNGNYEVVETEDLIEALVKLAESTDAKVEIISGETEEGEMLNRSFGGLAAILKYRQFG